MLEREMSNKLTTLQFGLTCFLLLDWQERTATLKEYQGGPGNEADLVRARARLREYSRRNGWSVTDETEVNPF